MQANDVTTWGGKTAAAYQNILEDIVLGRRLPGTAIDREAVARALGISVQPVTTAIDQLSADGFVDIRLQRGSFVAPIRLSHMLEAVFVISALMRAAFRFVRPERDAEALRRLEASLSTICDEAERGDFLAVIAAVRDYRDTMVVSGTEALARAEGVKAGAYLRWSISQILRRYPPHTQPPEAVRSLCRRIATQYSEMHRALLAGDALRHAMQVAELHADGRRAFREMAKAYPAVIES